MTGAYLGVVLMAPVFVVPLVGLTVTLATRGPRWLARRFGVLS